jgi:hypothetical protein
MAWAYRRFTEPVDTVSVATGGEDSVDDDEEILSSPKWTKLAAIWSGT